MTQAENPFEVGANVPPIGALLAQAEGRELSEDAQARLDAWLSAIAEAEKYRAALGMVDLEEIMLLGAPDPEMLIPDLFVRGVHHLVYGKKESGKTWLLLVAAVILIMRGETVIWVDKEMGAKELARRLVWIGAPPEVVGKHFVCLDHPFLDCSPSSVSLWTALLEAKQPALVVIDAQTEVLADADLNENLGTDVSKWTSRYIDPATRMGAATCFIDHTGHEEQGRARGSGHKGNASKVELLVEKDDKFDTERLGTIKVIRKKNTLSAKIPEKQLYELGGERADNGKFKFVFRPTELEAERDGSAEFKLRSKIMAVLQERAPEPLTQNQLCTMVGGNKATVIRLAGELADSGLNGVTMTPAGRSIHYAWVQDDD